MSARNAHRSGLGLCPACCCLLFVLSVLENCFSSSLRVLHTLLPKWTDGYDTISICLCYYIENFKIISYSVNIYIKARIS